MESRTHEISQSRGRGVKEREDLRRPHRPSDHTELDPLAGGDGPSTTKTQSWSKDIQTDEMSSLYQNSHSTTDHIPKDKKAMKSALNPFANEFVPHQPISNAHQPQQQLEKAGLSPYAEEFVPRSTVTYSNYREPEEEPEFNHTIEDTYPIHELKNFLFEVTFSPEKFDHQLHYLTDVLNQSISDRETLRTIVNVIFEESIQEPNFRYNGAKLCNHLSQNLHSSSSEIEKFRTVLLKRCQAKHKDRESFATSEDRGVYLRGYALFLAELYSQLEIQMGNVKERVENLGIAVLEVLDTLLKFATPENLKCACQILKCVGAYLEDQRRNVANSDLDVIFLKLKKAMESDSCSRDIKRMMSSVLELRAVDWGRSSHSSSPSSEPVQETTCRLNEPVFYGPDGLPISAEETLFLESQQLSPEFPDMDEYDEDIYGSDEMDEGIQEAYEEFLRATNQ